VANRKLGKYEVTERLGRGGMAEVYRAYHASLDRFVAIKVLHAFLADDPEFKNRFEKEARNIAKLKHPNIVQVYDFDYDAESESYYMVMELVEGLTLKDLLFKMAEQGRLPTLREAVRFVKEVASALAYAHSQSMVHRDVKPGNLMLDRDERLVLTDFGIAKIVTNQQFTATGGMVGTPAYMSPEQGLGEAGDERSDLYSLGVILFQLVTGKLPYDAETPLAVILKHLNEPIPSARSLRPDLPEAIDRIIIKLMAKDPIARYQSANEVITDLEQVDRMLDEPAVERQSAIGKVYDTIDLKMPKISRAVSNAGLPAVPSERPSQQHRPPTLPTKPQITSTGTRPPVTEVPVAPERRFPWWLLTAILVLIIAVGGYWIGATQGAFPMLGFLASPTPTATETESASPTPLITETPEPTDTATPEPTNTEVAVIVFTDTPSPTPTSTATDTPVPTDTSTPTATDSPTPTETTRPTRTSTPTSTPTPTITLTATPDVTQTLIQATMLMEIQTATTEACRFNYEIIDQDPADGDLFPTNATYVRHITLRNTGTCPWERNSSLTFISGESFNALPRIFIRDRVNVGDQYVLSFEGRTPSRGGVLSGVWELRTPGQIPIGDAMTIAIQVYAQG
jgi:serine/threonine protein kinase